MSMKLIELKLEDEDITEITFRVVLGYCNHWMDDTGNEFSFSKIDIGKHLINLTLLKTKKNMILEVEKWDKYRLNIKYGDMIEPMGQSNKGGWRIMLRDAKGIRR